MSDKCKRLLALLTTAMLLVCVLGMVGFAAETAANGPECYEHGDVNGDGSINGKDAIRVLYASVYGEEKYPVNQDCNFTGGEKSDKEDAIYLLYASMNTKGYQLKGTVHNYYDPTWAWNESEGTVTASVTFKCGCGESHTLTAEVMEPTVNAATCTANGSAAYRAKVEFDGNTYTSDPYTVVLPAAGHSLVGEQTCTTARTCENCDYSLPALGHDLQPTGVKTDATCTEGSKVEYACSRCEGYTETRTNDDVLGHNYQYVDNGDTLVEGCKYLKHYVCQACGTEKEAAEEDYYYVHNYSAALTKEATCAEPGVKTFTCACGDSYTEAVPVNDSHDWVEGETVDGVTTHSCSRCEATKTTVSAVAPISKDALGSVDEVQLDHGTSVSLDEDTLNGLDAEKQITISVEPVAKTEVITDAETLAQIGGDVVYDFTMQYDDGTAVEFSGKVTVSLPYTLQEGDDVDNIDVWYIDDAGNLKNYRGTYANGYVTFETDHFSYYTVTRLTTKQRCELYGHDTTTKSKAATCTEDGYTMEVCIRCGHVENEETLKAFGHSYKEEKNIAADCVNEGEIVQTCETCGNSLTTKQPALGHVMEDDAAQHVDASCTAPGKNVSVCKREGCDHSVEEEIKQLEHSYQDDNKDATCTEKGYKKQICSNCGDTVLKEEIAPLGHEFKAENVQWEWADDLKTANVKLICSHDETHVLQLQAVVTVAPAENACELAYNATITYNKVPYTVTVTVPDHSPAKDWSYNAAQHYHECQGCKEKLDVANHNFGAAKVTKAPTCKDTGISESACTVCGFKKTETIPATGVHNYVNGVCSVCGNQENACFHVRMHETKLDLSAYNICEGMEIYEYRCDCGEQVYADWNLKCAFEETTREETLPNGNTYTVWVYTCTECGLVIERAYYTLVTVDPCQAQGTSWHRISIGDAVISEGIYQHRYDQWSHPYNKLTDEVSLTMETHGICGGNILFYDCPCGEVTHVEYQYQCNWNYSDDESYYEENKEVNVTYCSECGAKRVRTWIYDQNVENCVMNEIQNVVIYKADGTETFAYEVKNVYDSHAGSVYDYEFDNGETCEDGILLTYKCNKCNHMWQSYWGWHVPIEHKETDLRDADICYDWVYEYSCVCPVNESYYDFMGENYCQWVLVEGSDKGDEYSHSYQQVCSVCGAVKDYSYVSTPKDENCNYSFTAKVVYTDKNGNHIYSFESPGTGENHNYEYTYELLGDSCEDGWQRYRTCSDCGASELWDSGSGHSTRRTNTYNLADYGMCGGEMWEYSCLCGQEQGVSFNWNCSFEWVGWADDNTEVYFCNTCNTYRHVTHEELEQVDPCHIRTRYTYAFWRDEQELLGVTYERLYNDHRWVYELTLNEGATDCSGGYSYVATCLDCGETHSNSGSSDGHPNYIVAREYVSQGQLCGNLEKITRACPCGEYYSEEIYWENGNCNFEGNYWSEEDDCWVNVCSTCKAEYLSYHTFEDVEGDPCAELGTHRQIYRKDGETLVEVETHWTNYDHDYVYNFAEFEMQGDTCTDGYRPVGYCNDCGTKSNHGWYSGHSWFTTSIEEIYDGAETCSPIRLKTRSCPCGYNNTVEMYFDCNWNHIGWNEQTQCSIYKCSECGMKFEERYNEEREPGSCQTIVTRYYKFYLGDVVLGEKEYSYTTTSHQYVHSFEKLGETCADGYYVTRSCALCGYSDGYRELRYNCNTYRIEYYDLAALGACDGAVWVNSCPCGQKQDLYWDRDCEYEWTGVYDPETGVEQSICRNCEMVYYAEEIGQRNNDTCMYEGTKYFKMIVDDEVKLDLTAPFSWESHYTNAVAFELFDEEMGCDGGYYVTEQCKYCDFSTTEINYGCHGYEVKKLKLTEEDGCCGFEIWQNECACGDYQTWSWWHNCHFQSEDWNETDENGVIHDFSKYTCRDCGLETTHERYTVWEEDTCYGEYYDNRTVTFGDITETFYEHGTTSRHDWAYTYTLAEGSVSCEDSVRIHAQCRSCGYEEDWYSSYGDSHPKNVVETIDLNSLCGATLNHLACPCGEQERYEIDEDSKCDMDYQYAEPWIENVINDEYQNTIQGGRWLYSDFYLVKCAVSDPEVCGLTLRMAEYWVKEGCKAVEYQTWQLGYDEATGTFDQEFTVATGETHTWHDYEETHSTEEAEDGSYVEINSQICKDCGSSYVWKNYYNADGYREKYEREIINTLSDEHPQKSYHIREYMCYSGYEFDTLERDEVTYADGSISWDQWAYTYDFTNGCSYTCVHTTSGGYRDTWTGGCRYGSYRWETVKQPTCTQFGVEIETSYCPVCGKENQQWTYDVEPYDHDWGWNGECYYCYTCGLESVTGASGSIVMEDLTDDYDGTEHVVGYWNSGEVAFVPNLTVILNDAAEGEEDQLYLDFVTEDFRFWTVEKDGINAISFNKEAAYAAAAEVVEAAGYTGSYAIRISLVPTSGEDELDYAITFDSLIQE